MLFPTYTAHWFGLYMPMLSTVRPVMRYASLYDQTHDYSRTSATDSRVSTITLSCHTHARMEHGGGVGEGGGGGKGVCEGG